MFERVAPPHILKIVPYRPGKPISEVKRELGLERVVKLASNENPLGPSPRAVEVIRTTVDQLHYYPEDSAWYLRKRLSEVLGLPTEMICPGSGSTELIINVGRAFLRPGDEILTAAQSFVMYYLCGAYTNNPVIQVPLRNWGYDLEAMAAALTPRTRVVFLANPNNPTGTYFNRADWERFVAQVPPEVLVVLDEAYCEYVDRPDYPNGLDYLSQYPNLLVLRTFSKIYGLAGIRAGYGVATPEVVDLLLRVKLPFNANALGQEAAVAALDDHPFVARSRAVNAEGLAYLTAEMSRLGVEWVPSVANFLQINLPVPGQVVFEKLLPQGVVVRPLQGFGIPGAIRVTIGRMEENRVFAAAMAEAMAEVRAGRA